jgi:GNAT superfamily N-acetyltransferase
MPRLQHFFEANPEYFLAVNGQGPGADEALEEFHSVPPAGWPYTRKWSIGFVDTTGSLIGMADVVSDLLAPGVWHIGLMIVATRIHGTGAGPSLYVQLERWARDSGAHWLRLGVVEGNARAERFWSRCGFAEVRKRGGVVMGRRVNTVRVLVKPLAGGTLPGYPTSVTRDRPESP